VRLHRSVSIAFGWLLALSSLAALGVFAVLFVVGDEPLPAWPRLVGAGLFWSFVLGAGLDRIRQPPVDVEARDEGESSP